MQQRRKLPFFMIGFIVVALVCLFAASYVFVPEAKQMESVQNVDISKLMSDDGTSQPAEYP